MLNIGKKLAGGKKMLDGAKGMTVAKKLMALVGLLVALMIVVAATGIYQMSRIGIEITEIAEQDLPLIEIVSAITTHQLEQAVNFERALRYGMGMEQSERARGHFTKAVETFEELARKVDEEVKKGEEIAEHAIANASNAESRAEFEHVLAALKTIEKEHQDFNKGATHVMELLAEGEVFEAIEAAEQVELEEEQLDHELEALLEEIEKFTQQSALTAEEHERFGMVLMVIVSAIAAIGGLALTAWLVRRIITGPLVEVVGALTALAEGDTTASVEVRSNDEIGALAKAFEEFREKTIEAQKLVEAQAEAERKAEEEKRAALLQLADGLEQSVGQVIEAVASGT
ncbi:MAG: HAMP domain-containing protein, partial [Proteobacteria bacterium]|nr:HAMP domain-containing protein [Pseudomonadota bacterium]